MTVEEVRVTKEDKIEYGAVSSNHVDDIEYKNHKIHVKVKVTGDGREEQLFYTDILSVFSNNGLGNPDEAHQRHYLVSEETDTVMRIPGDGSRIYEMTFFCTQEPVEPILVFGGYRQIEDLDNMGVLKLY